MRNALSRYVTKTGRAKSPGRVTRKSLALSRGHDGRPLPIELQCHPKKLSPTKINPGCLTYNPVSGKMVATMKAMRDNTVGFSRGDGLDGKGPIRLYVQGWGEFWHSDLIEALGWSRAAKEYGYEVEVYQ